MDSIFTLVIVSFLVMVALMNCKVVNDEMWFMSLGYTKPFKAIMCIIVIFVHIPQQYSNKLQDAIGSFGYICVTLFFLFSSFGLLTSLNSKDNYLKDFFKKRFLVVLIPYLIVSVFSTIVFHDNLSNFEIIKSCLGIAKIDFVTVLLFFYIIFYIIARFVRNNKIKYSLFIVFPIIYSAINYFVGIDKWYIEELGFSYGFLLYFIIQKKRFGTDSKKITTKVNSLYIFKIIALGILCGIFGILYLKTKEVFIIGEYIVRAILGILMIFLVFIITRNLKMDNVIIRFLSGISFEIYLLHRTIIKGCTLIPNLCSWKYIYIVIIITVLFATVLNYIDKRIIVKLKT